MNSHATAMPETTALPETTARQLLDPDAANLAAHDIHTMPVVVIAMHEGCECRCVMCDIWKIREPREMAISSLERQLESFEKLGVRWVVLTGGEPQRHSHFREFTEAVRSRGIRVTLLTAGLDLEAEAKQVAYAVDDLIVSLDGPASVHDQIRRVPGAFEKLTAGIRAVRSVRPEIAIRARCTVQSANHQSLCRTVECAKEMGLDSISFLAADVTSAAFNRPLAWGPSRQNAVALDGGQVRALEQEIERLINTYGGGGFVVESTEKLRRIVLHFRAHLGQTGAVAPRCNAPWVSAVIEVGGDVRPCFFHAAVGNIRQQTLAEVVNSPAALQFRSKLDISTNPACRRCVCSLYVPPA
jgi:Fe-coproporphyrin III synthase